MNLDQVFMGSPAAHAVVGFLWSQMKESKALVFVHQRNKTGLQLCEDKHCRSEDGVLLLEQLPFFGVTLAADHYICEIIANQAIVLEIG